MLDRSELKSRAKAAFKGKYWRVFTACLIVFAITALLGGGSLLSEGLSGSGLSLSFSGLDFPGYDDSVDNEILFYDQYIDAGFADGFFSVLMIIIAVIVFIVFIASIISAVKNVLVVNPLNVGLKTYFMKNRENKEDFKDVFSGFTNGSYGSIVKTIFTTDILIFLWSLLFVIPGIYHRYVYWFVPYICAEKADVSASEARRLSRAIADGYKLEIFVMELSFIGWRILGFLIIFGNYFIEPYIQATYAEMYVELRDRAVAAGKIRPEEVGFSAYENLESESFGFENQF